MNNKDQARIRRIKKARANMKRLNKNRLTVHRTNQHVYAQIISPENTVLAMASSNDPKLRKALKNNGSNVEAAKLVGETIASLAKKKKVGNISFDRSGYAYHGRIKAVADSAREAGLKF